MSAQPEALPVAWVNASNLSSAAISRQRGGPFDKHTWSEQQTDYHDTPMCAAAELRRLHALNAQMLEALEWLESKARAGKLEIAPSLLGSGFEFGFWPHGVVRVVSAPTLLAAIAAAKEQA